MSAEELVGKCQECEETGPVYEISCPRGCGEVVTVCENCYHVEHGCTDETEAGHE